MNAAENVGAVAKGDVDDAGDLHSTKASVGKRFDFAVAVCE